MTDSFRPNFSDVTGVILAGGKSQRMGRDKATLPFDGRRLFDRVLSFQQSLFDKVIIAGDRPDLAVPGVPFYPDLYPGSAMGGLYTGLSNAETPWIMVVACDMPNPSVELALLLLGRREGAEVVTLRTPKGLEPLFSLYHQNCLPAMRERLENRDFRIINFFPAIRLSYLDWPEGICNINTQEEYELRCGRETR